MLVAEKTHRINKNDIVLIKGTAAELESIVDILKQKGFNFTNTDSIPSEVVVQDIYKEFGGKAACLLAGYRLKLGLTQKKLAEMLTVSQSNISAYEQGKRPVGKDMAKRFAQIFNVDYRTFL